MCYKDTFLFDNYEIIMFINTNFLFLFLLNRNNYSIRTFVDFVTLYFVTVFGIHELVTTGKKEKIQIT